MNKIVKAFKKPRTALIWLWWKCSMFIVSDALYLKVYYRLMMREKLDLHNPKTFNQKTQWLKLHNKKERYTKMVDKYGVREIIKKEIGEEYLIPLLGVWNEFDDIDFSKLPDEFVLKTTHDSESLIICKDKSKLDIDSARKKFNKSLHSNYYYRGREYPYKNVPPRIICEEYMVDESGKELKDYKFFCFDGEPKFFFVGSNRFSGLKLAYYDMNLNRLPFNTGKYGKPDETVTKIESFDKMTEIARKLSEGIPFVRIDLYNITGKIYFGEFTFFHDGGISPFNPPEWDRKFGDLITLPNE